MLWVLRLDINYNYAYLEGHVKKQTTILYTHMWYMYTIYINLTYWFIIVSNRIQFHDKHVHVL